MAGLFARGLVHVHYGDGQGKTTAAAGLTARVSGSGGRALFAQFLKSGTSGELQALAAMRGVDVLCTPCAGFLRDMDETERSAAVAAQREAFARAVERAATGAYDLLVLDEIIDLADMQIISADELLAALRGKPARLEIVLTGHRPFAELLDAADYVTEVRKAKHPYDKGIRARKGAEF